MGLILIVLLCWNAYLATGVLDSDMSGDNFNMVQSTEGDSSLAGSFSPKNAVDTPEKESKSDAPLFFEFLPTRRDEADVSNKIEHNGNALLEPRVNALNFQSRNSAFHPFRSNFDIVTKQSGKKRTASEFESDHIKNVHPKDKLMLPDLSHESLSLAPSRFPHPYANAECFRQGSSLNVEKDLISNQICDGVSSRPGPALYKPISSYSPVVVKRRPLFLNSSDFDATKSEITATSVAPSESQQQQDPAGPMAQGRVTPIQQGRTTLRVGSGSSRGAETTLELAHSQGTTVPASIDGRVVFTMLAPRYSVEGIAGERIRAIAARSGALVQVNTLYFSPPFLRSITITGPGSGVQVVRTAIASIVAEFQARDPSTRRHAFPRKPMGAAAPAPCVQHDQKYFGSNYRPLQSRPNQQSDSRMDPAATPTSEPF